MDLEFGISPSPIVGLQFVSAQGYFEESEGLDHPIDRLWDYLGGDPVGMMERGDHDMTAWHVMVGGISTLVTFSMYPGGLIFGLTVPDGREEVAKEFLRDLFREVHVLTIEECRARRGAGRN